MKNIHFFVTFSSNLRISNKVNNYSQFKSCTMETKIVNEKYNYGIELITENFHDIENSVEKILYENRLYKICLVDDDVYMTNTELIACSPNDWCNGIVEAYVSGFIDKNEFEEEIATFVDAVEMFKKYINI